MSEREDWSMLHRLAHQCDVQQLESALAQGPEDLEGRDSEGRTPLMLAAAGQSAHDEGARLAAVELLLDTGSRATARDSAGMTAVHYAALHGHEDVLIALVDPRMIPNQQRPPRSKPEMPTKPRAFREQVLSTDAVDEAVPVHGVSRTFSSHGGRRPRGPLEGPNNLEQRPLHVACTAGHLQVVRGIMKRCANPNHQDREGCTALHSVVQGASAFGEAHALELFEALASRRGLDLAVRDNKRRTALQLACANGSCQLVQALLRAGAVMEAPLPSEDAQLECDSQFASAVAAADMKTAADLAARGLPAAPEPMNGWTPLHVAARAGRPDALETLLGLGHCLEHRDHQGRSALMLAVEAGASHSEEHSAEALQRLLSAGASVNARDDRGMTAVHHGTLGGRVGVMQQLMRWRPRPHLQAETNDENTALHLAALCGHADMVQLLLDHGSMIDKPNCLGETPLHCAVLGSGSVEGGVLHTVRLLLEVEQRANLNAVTRKGCSALMLAAANGSLELVQALLRSKGHTGRAGGRSLDLNVSDSMGNTAAHKAGYCGWEDIVQALREAGANMELSNADGLTAEQALAIEQADEVTELLESVSLNNQP